MIEALIVLGLLSHMLSDMIEASRALGQPIHPLKFVKERPYRLVLSAIGAFVGYAFFINDLQKQVDAELYLSAYATALGIGYASDSLINKAANIAQSKIGGIDGG